MRVFCEIRHKTDEFLMRIRRFKTEVQNIRDGIATYDV